MRYAIAVEYDGSPFCGWQRQKHSASVQQELEQALGKVADHDVCVVCAGRTDTGVHALAQIAHFDTVAERPERAWIFGTNTHLHPAVAVHWVKAMPQHFHARYSAQLRSYRYTILNRTARAGYLREYSAWISRRLDIQPMRAAAHYLIGTHDFSAFRSADCQARHAIRDITRIAVTRHDELVEIEVTGNAFLHNMVRIIAGSLIRVGLGERPPEWIGELLLGRDRTLAGMTAPAAGLCFLQPTYPAEFGVPSFWQRRPS